MEPEEGSISFTLGVKEPQTFTVKPLVFSQARSIVPALTKFYEVHKGKLDSEESFDLIGSAIIIAVRKDVPTFARITLDSLDCTVAQIIIAIDLLTDHAKIFKKKDAPKPGESITESSDQEVSL